MSKVIFDMSISLDGLVKASNSTPQLPLGEGGQRLHHNGASARRTGATVNSSPAGWRPRKQARELFIA